jgi:sugar fermentation stimulation protein A
MNACTNLCQTLKAASLPLGGTYIVLLWLPAAQHLAIGRRGQGHFPRGYYTYTGSAKRALTARLHRHLHGASTRHWHLDYFRPYAQVLAWQAYGGDRQPECQLNQRLARWGQVVMAKFGAADCSCPAHLLYYPRRALAMHAWHDIAKDSVYQSLVKEG